MKTRGKIVVALVLAIAALSVRAADDKPAPAAAASDAAGSATGTWKWSFQGPGGNDVQMVLKLKQDGEKLTGTVTGFGGQETDIQDGTVKDKQVSFKVVRDMGGMKSTTTYTAELADGTLKGKSETVFTRSFEAKRAAE
jgi:hypothetical protein